MNRTFPFLLAAATVVAVGCAKDNRTVETATAASLTTSASDSIANANGRSQVRVVNAVPGGKDIAVRIGEVTLFDDVKPNAVTDYRETALNIARFTVQPAGVGDGIMVDEKDGLLLDGDRYTVFLIADDVSRNSLRVIRDDISPDRGKARIRIIHAAYGAPELNVGVVGAKDMLFAGVDFKGDAGYRDVPPATVSLAVRATDGKGKVLLRIPRVKLARGTATTVVITGASTLGYFTFTDKPIGMPKP